jgi:putative sporulation protein YyaC
MDSITSAEELALSVLSFIPDSAQLTVICVGTDRCTGDSLGPLVGSMLVELGFKGDIYGTLEEPVHAENLGEVYPILEKAAKGTTILGVDACLGTRQEIGSIIVKSGPLRPGLGVRKKLRPIGDLHIAGVVNVGGFMEYMVLQNTRLNLVIKMAQVIAKGIYHANHCLDKASYSDLPAGV